MENKEANGKEFNPVSYFENAYSIAKKNRSNFEVEWYRNSLFYIGKQWIKYDSKENKWRKAVLPSWFPQPVTNKFAVCVDTIKSVLKQIRPQLVHTPATEDVNDVNAAKVAEDISDICFEESGFREIQEMMRLWLVLTGNVFIQVYYDKSEKYGSVAIPIYQCANDNCGFLGTIDKFKDNMCPVCGSREYFDTGETEKYPKGKIRAEVIPPFEIFANVDFSSIDEQPFILRAKTYSIDVIKKRWEKGKDIEPGENAKSETYLYDSLAYATNSSGLGIGISQQGGGKKAELATVWEMWVRPTKDLPNGYHGFICNGVELEGGDIEYEDDKGQPFIPVVHISSNVAPNRLFGKSFVDDLVHKQIHRNKLEAFITLAVNRTSNPVWLIPRNCGVENISGEPGEIIRYNASNTATNIPTRLGGVELTNAVFRVLEKIDMDFEELASTYDVLKGNTPRNVPTLGGLELLKERAVSRFTPMIESLENGLKKLDKYMLHIFKQYGSDKRFKIEKTPNGQWKMKSFTKADIDGNVDIKVEPGSSNPRSEAYEQFIVGQLLQNGLIDVNDPMIRFEIMKIFHADKLAGSLRDDIEDARKEEQEFIERGITRLRADIDNHQVHLACHLKFAKSDRFFSLSEEKQSAFTNHILETKQYLVNQIRNMQAIAPQTKK